MGKSVLVVALDGLDYNLIEEFGMEAVRQEEFGRIDNQTGMFSIKTSELFASFITGMNYEEHGIRGIKYWKDRRMDRIVNFLEDKFDITKRRGGYRLKQFLNIFFRSDKAHPNKEQLEVDSLFEKIENSKAMYVPGYNPSPYFCDSGLGIELKCLDVENHESEFYWDIYEYSRRRRELFRPVNRWHDFLMVHIHRPDHHHHMYGDPESRFDREKLRRLYKNGLNDVPDDKGIEGFVEEVKEFFGDSYDYIIFMSDHGLPTQWEHNENAFYSCNKNLFPDSRPKITDFHDRILELVE